VLQPRAAGFVKPASWRWNSPKSRCSREVGNRRRGYGRPLDAMMSSNLSQMHPRPHLATSTFAPYNNYNYDERTDLMAQALQHQQRQQRPPPLQYQQQHLRRSSNPAARSSQLSPQRHSRFSFVPLPVKSSATSQSARPMPQQTVQDGEEHMLRRKTPNGTLSAGYDGTPVEWGARPSANKHMLISDQTASSINNFPAAARGPSPRHNASFNARINQYDQDKWRAPTESRYTASHQLQGYAALGDGTQGTQQWWSSGTPPFADSMLHQAAPMQPQYYAGYQQVPTVLQQPWPPSVGPTVSSAQGPFGPYWPNGAYVPYRPAPMRDARFNSQFASISLDDPLEHQLSRDNRDWQYDLSAGHPNTGNLLSHSQNHIKSDGYLQQPHIVDHNTATNALPRDSVHSPWSTPLSVRGRPSLLSSTASSQYPSSEPFSQQYAMSPARQSERQSGGLHFRDKTLRWAHRVYVSLLATMQQARRQAHSKNLAERRHSQPTYFPKPPKYSAGKDTAVGACSVQRGSAWLSSPPQFQKGPVDTGHLGQSRNQGSFYERTFHTPQHSLQMDAVHRQQTPGMLSPSLSQYITFDQSQGSNPVVEAQAAFDMLQRLVGDSEWQWVNGMLLGGCLAYGLNDFHTAQVWYGSVLKLEPENVEALSNMAATCSGLGQRQDAELYWRKAIELRPSYFEAIEHLVGLLCSDGRAKQAVEILQNMEARLRLDSQQPPSPPWETAMQQPVKREDVSSFDADKHMKSLSLSVDAPVVSGYDIAPCDNGRLIALIHAKGNMLYSIGNNAGASQAFEDAVMVAAGKSSHGIGSLIKHILKAFAREVMASKPEEDASMAPCETILLLPSMALKTAELVFPGRGTLPGLRDVPEGQPRKAAVSVASNSLLSLAKIYQDGMSSSGNGESGNKASPGVHDILALYYLSLSLQPSPSTANNVGILLAGIQQSVPPKAAAAMQSSTNQRIAGVVPGSGVALALEYYNYGLNLDIKHAHLYTNLGSLLKDIGQLGPAITMYQRAVACDGNFDIALANLANAVKDQGRIKDAIEYYQRAVNANPDFAEAVCGLANALNSVCSWRGRGGVIFKDRKFDMWHVDTNGDLQDVTQGSFATSGWIGRVVSIVEKQLKDGEAWGRGVLRTREGMGLFPNSSELMKHERTIKTAMLEWLSASGEDWEGARVVRLVERATKRLTWQIYREKYVHKRTPTERMYGRPPLPSSLSVPSAPTVLPFHTFTCPLTADQIRKISQRNGLRISCSTLKAPWLPTTVYDPPAPPAPQLNVGYVSSDFNNHPLAHLMQSVFGFHDTSKVKAFCYATTASDNSSHRQQIQAEAPVFYDASSWSVERLVKQVLEDGIHILINLNGYTRGARNELFAARPAPIQMSFMGFAGTLGAEWCDYILADATAIPPSTLRPFRDNVDLMDLTKDQNFGGDDVDWVYGENIIYARDTFFCCDHRQSAPDSREPQLTWGEEQERRKRMRKELFPEIPDDAIILGNFNQLYKVWRNAC
jgi:predicted O-linked N-acetylglucosamine transferase (SPINDLY family)